MLLEDRLEKWARSMRPQGVALIVLNEAHLQRILAEYFEYYHQARAHLSPDRNAPVPRTVELPIQSRVVSIPMVGGLHHRYKRAARTRDGPTGMARGGGSTPFADWPCANAKPFRHRSKLQFNTPSRSLRWRWRLADRTIWHRLPRVASWMRYSVETAKSGDFRSTNAEILPAQNLGIYNY